MARETFDRDLKKLQDDLLVLGDMVAQAVNESVEALKKRDVHTSRRIFANDRIINEKRYAIEHFALSLIATQQPMARDLRLLAAVLEINTELERIGDYAKGICRVNILLGNEPLIIQQIEQICKMAEISLGMLRRALTAFVEKNAETARKIPQEDDQVDQLYNQINRDLIQTMINDPAVINRANYVMWAAHDLERLADRATNICERTVFMVTGQIIEMDQTDAEQELSPE